MATRQFTLTTEPHTATVGPHTLRFMPEAPAAQFMDAFHAMQERMKAAEDTEGGDPEGMLNASLGFLAAFAHDDETTHTLETVDLPMRVIGELSKWLFEIYGGGEGGEENGARPTESSTASPRASRRNGTTSTPRSSSKASTSTRSRRAG